MQITPTENYGIFLVDEVVNIPTGAKISDIYGNVVSNHNVPGHYFVEDSSGKTMFARLPKDYQPREFGTTSIEGFHRLTIAKRMKVVWVRDSFPWNEIQPNNTSEFIVPTSREANMATWKSNGFKQTWITSPQTRIPLWIKTPDTYANGVLTRGAWKVTPVEFLNYWKNYIQLLYSRYGNGIFYEVYNEPADSCIPTDSTWNVAKVVLEMHKICAQIIPVANLIGPNGGVPVIGWELEAAAANLNQYITAHSYHDYQGRAVAPDIDSDPIFLPVRKRWQGHIEKYGAKPIHVNEWGVYGLSALGSPTGVIDVTNIPWDTAWKRAFKTAILYQERNDLVLFPFQIVDNLSSKIEWAGYDGLYEPQPKTTAFLMAQHLLYGATWIATDTSTNLRNSKWKLKSGQEVEFLWAKEGTTVTHNYSNLIDIFGNLYTGIITDTPIIRYLQSTTDCGQYINENNVLKARITTLNSQIATLSTEKVALQNQLNTCSTDKAALQNQVNSLNTQIATLNAKVTQLEQQLANTNTAALQTQVSTLTNKINSAKSTLNDALRYKNANQVKQKVQTAIQTLS